uniref:LRRNT domain-containing protein n=1 Tax=Biomphalaria glabrata TaxID=6526 RepID=A0A2C9LBX8_BIOGL
MTLVCRGQFDAEMFKYQQHQPNVPTKVNRELVFHGLTRLKHIDLSNNSISSINDDSFVGTALDDLDLSYNHLTSVPVTAIQRSSQFLIKLSLAHNQIASISNSDLKDFTFGTLDLSDNQITHISKDLFDNVNIVETIDLSGNPITSISQCVPGDIAVCASVCPSKVQLPTDIVIYKRKVIALTKGDQLQKKGSRFFLNVFIMLLFVLFVLLNLIFGSDVEELGASVVDVCVFCDVVEELGAGVVDVVCDGVKELCASVVAVCVFCDVVKLDASVVAVCVFCDVAVELDADVIAFVVFCTAVEFEAGLFAVFVFCDVVELGIVVAVVGIIEGGVINFDFFVALDFINVVDFAFVVLFIFVKVIALTGVLVCVVSVFLEG